MSSNPVLFVGGSKDGERISIEQNRHRVSFRVYSDNGLHEETYSRCVWICGGQEFEVFTTKTYVDAFQMLLDGYRKPMEAK